MTDHTKRIEDAKAVGNVSKATAKRMIEKVAKDIEMIMPPKWTKTYLRWAI